MSRLSRNTREPSYSDWADSAPEEGDNGRDEADSAPEEKGDSSFLSGDCPLGDDCPVGQDCPMAGDSSLQAGGLTFRKDLFAAADGDDMFGNAGPQEAFKGGELGGNLGIAIKSEPGI